MRTRRLPPAIILLLALLVPVSTLLPVWQAYHSASPPEKIFLGFRYMPGDHYQYAAFARQARDDASVLMRDPFTTEPQKGRFVLLYFWILGRFSAITGLTITTAWELFRLIGGAFYILTFWYLTAAWFERIRTRVLATFVFSLAGGLGWLVTLLGLLAGPGVNPLRYPFDFFWNWSTFGTMAVPNWIWPAFILMLAMHAILARARFRDLATFVLPPIVWFMHGYSGFVAYAILGMLPLMPLLRSVSRLEPPAWDRARSNLRIALPGIVSFGVVAAHLIFARSDDVFRAVSAHGFAWTDSFALWWYPLGYGLLLLAAWWGLRDLRSEESLATDLLLCWMAAAFMLSVNHFFAGVKFQYLLYPPIAVLAAKGLERMKTALAARPGNRWKPVIVGVLFGTIFLDAPVSLIKDMPVTAEQSEIFITGDELDAMAFLDKQPPGVVLAGYWNGNRIPWLAGKDVYVGHWFMTIQAREKSVEVAQFFRPQVPAEQKRAFLARSGASYLFYGAAEARLGSVDPDLPLRKIYEKGMVAVYSVETGRSPFP